MEFITSFGHSGEGPCFLLVRPLLNILQRLIAQQKLSGHRPRSNIVPFTLTAGAPSLDCRDCCGYSCRFSQNLQGVAGMFDKTNTAALRTGLCALACITCCAFSYLACPMNSRRQLKHRARVQGCHPTMPASRYLLGLGGLRGMHAEAHNQVPARLSTSSFLLQWLVLQCSAGCLLGVHACMTS